MNIQEFYDSIDENYENVSSRMMGNQNWSRNLFANFWRIQHINRLKNLLRRWIMMRF